MDAKFTQTLKMSLQILKLQPILFTYNEIFLLVPFSCRFLYLLYRKFIRVKVDLQKICVVVVYTTDKQLVQTHKEQTILK